MIWVSQRSDGKLQLVDEGYSGDEEWSPAMAFCPALAPPVAFTSPSGLRAVAEGRSGWMFPDDPAHPGSGSIPLYIHPVGGDFIQAAKDAHDALVSARAFIVAKSGTMNRAHDEAIDGLRVAIERVTK